VPTSGDLLGLGVVAVAFLLAVAIIRLALAVAAYLDRHRPEE
jgi:hypothetical protein